MELKIKASPAMAMTASLLGSVEDRLVRVPEEIRKVNNIEIGEFLSFHTAQGDIYLQVAKAYKMDAESDKESIYVSQDTHDRIILKTISKIKPTADILVGCDPEFFLMNNMNGMLISASNFFAHHGDVGSDCGLAELRPRPDFKAEKLTSYINALLKKAHDHISRKKILKVGHVEMVAASYMQNKSAGFHIHFGLPAFMLKENAYTKAFLTQLALVLDYYVGILAVIPEGEEDSLRRSKQYSHYGKPGAFRFDQITFEYRVPGGHLLRHPVLTAGILAIGMLAMKDMVSRIKAYTNDFKRPFDLNSYEGLRKMYPNLPDRDKVYEAVTATSTGPALSYANAIFKDLSRMIGFSENKVPVVDYFSYIINLTEKKEKFEQYIVPNWRLV